MSLLQTVLRKFYPAESQPQPQTAKPAPAAASRLNHYAPLFELLSKRQLLEIVSDQTAERYQSMILDINVAAGLLMLDDLFPADPMQPVQVGDTLTLRHHYNGKILSFSSPVIDIEHSEGGPLHILKLPKDVGYRQRRRWPRLSFSRQRPLRVQVKSPLRTPWFASAQNLSAGGMRLNIAGNLLDQLHYNQLLPLVEFQFNRDFRVTCQARVKGFRFSRRPHRHTQISIEFVDMAPHQRQQLQAFISAMIDSNVKAA